MKDQILELLEKKEYSKIKSLLEDVNVADIAELLEELDANELLVVFRLLQKDIAVDVFSYLTTQTQEEIITAATDKEIKQLVNELYFDDMVDLVEEMPASIVKKIISNVKESERTLVNHFLNYPENSAGSLMTIEYVDLKKDNTVRQALDIIKKNGVDKETIYTCYVIDESRKLEGTVSLKDLVISSDDKKIEDIMTSEFISVNTHVDREATAKMFKKYDLLAMPVVDKEERLVGIITVDDIIDVIDYENTEDFYKMAAITPSEEEYLDSKVFSLAKNRIVWLLVLMISATFTGYIIKSYDDAIQSVVILAMFIPLLMDTGGNAGSQSATIVIRGLALGQIKVKNVLAVLFKEFRISLIVGVVLAIVNFLRIILIDRTEPLIAFIVSITLFITIVLAKVVGCILPIVANKLKLDPAIMASPLITTIVDALSLIIYFAIATTLLGI